MNIVLINQFFPPAQAPTGVLLGNLASELARRGHAVTVIASAAGYGADAGAQSPEDGRIRVIRVGAAGQHRHGLAAKMGDYLSFFRRAWNELSSLTAKPDVIVCMTTPPFCGLLGARMRKHQGIPYVLWCMDLYPEALAAHGILGRENLVYGLLQRMARRERRNAAGVIALGPDMAALLESSGAATVEEVPVWSALSAPPDVQDAARALRIQRGWAAGEIVLLYSGNMGRAHRVDEFVALAQRLRGAAPRCRFVFSGGGPQRAEWERRWGGLFEFMPPVPANLSAAHLLAADVHLVSQQPEWMGIVVPSKFQAACALGRPVVFAGPPQSAVGGWMANADVGWRLPPGDAAAVDLAANGIPDLRLRTEKGRQAFQLFARKFTPSDNCGKLADQVEKAAREPT
jgi:glycosyltransferase involved in cell wall biosynthesis